VLRNSLLYRFAPLGFAALFGCGSGATGDKPSEPLANPYGAGLAVVEINGPATWEDPSNSNSQGCPALPERKVYVTGVSIGAIDNFDETGGGAVGNYYVQDARDPGQPYSGMTVFDPSFSPPDLRLAAGDVVDVFGAFSEFAGPSSGRFPFCRTLPEIGGTMSFRFDNNRPIEPTVVDVTELKSYEGARPYLGMLVRLENVKLATDGTNSSGRFTADLDVGGGIPVTEVPRISNELYDIQGQGPMLSAGTVFKSITGIVTYFYGFKVAPRSPADFELP